jgi:hypothetical protein
MSNSSGSRMRGTRKVARLLTAAAVAVTALSAAATGAVVVAGPAEATVCPPTIAKITVRDVVIYASSASRALTTVVAFIPCTGAEYSGSRISSVSGQAYLSNGYSWDLHFNDSTTSTYTGASGAYFDKYSAIGRGWESIEVFSSDSSMAYRNGVPFFVRRNVALASFNASPEPVRKGAAIKVSGLVSRLSVGAYGVAKYVPYAAHNVDIYFRPLTSSTYTKVSGATTNSAGSFIRDITATVDGCWKAYSVQTSNNVGRWSPADCVDVQ